MKNFVEKVIEFVKPERESEIVNLTEEERKVTIKKRQKISDRIFMAEFILILILATLFFFYPKKILFFSGMMVVVLLTLVNKYYYFHKVVPYYRYKK